MKNLTLTISSPFERSLTSFKVSLRRLIGTLEKNARAKIVVQTRQKIGTLLGNENEKDTWETQSTE
jgi:hypothetical protein